MPWTADDATRFTKRAGSESLRKLWAEVANGALKRGLSDGQAIREANAVVARQGSRGMTVGRALGGRR
jgi:hypothetical protein